MPQLYGLPDGVRIALDGNPDCEYISKFGYNADVDASAAPEDIWDGGGLYTGFPTGAAETAQIVSTSTADASAGTGLRTLLLSGLDANYEPQTETLTLNGTTPVTGTKLWTRINRCPGQTAGSGGTNAGAITVRHSSTTANVFAVIEAGVSQTQVSAFTVPAGYRAAFVDYRATASNASPSTAVRVQLAVMSRVFGSGTWRRNRSIWLSSGIGVANVHLDGAIIFQEKTDIVLRALAGASADNLQMTASMGFFLVRN